MSLKTPQQTSEQIPQQTPQQSIKIPPHVAIIMQGSSAWAQKNQCTLTEAYRKRFEIVLEILKTQIETGIPVTSFYLLPLVTDHKQNIMEKIDSLAEFLDKLKASEMLHKNSIKVSVWGRWYDLPGSLVESIKQIVEETKDYDTFFVNLYINYDGQEEIVNACQILARKVMAGKIDIEAINKESIKDETYSSGFLPPNLIIRTGYKHNLRGFLLWDSSNATIYFPRKLWPDFTKEDFIKAIEYYNKTEYYSNNQQ